MFTEYLVKLEKNINTMWSIKAINIVGCLIYNVLMYV